MFDRNRTRYTTNRQYPVHAGASIAAEGQTLVAVSDGAGGVDVQPSAGAGGEKFVGFARTDNLRGNTEVVMEQLTVPVGGGTVNLAHSNLVASTARVFNVTAGAAMTIVGGAPNAGEAQVNNTNGTVTFNVAQAGATVTVIYRYTMTTDQVKMKRRDSLPNNIAADYLSLVDAMGGTGVIFTDQFDSSVAYTILGTIYSGASGLLTSAAGGATVGYCVKIPSVADPLLGVNYSE